MSIPKVPSGGETPLPVSKEVDLTGPKSQSVLPEPRNEGEKVSPKTPIWDKKMSEVEPLIGRGALVVLGAIFTVATFPFAIIGFLLHRSGKSDIKGGDVETGQQKQLAGVILAAPLFAIKWALNPEKAIFTKPPTPGSERVEVESPEEEKIEQLKEIPQGDEKKTPEQIKQKFIEDFLPSFGLRYDEKAKKVLSVPGKEEEAKGMVNQRTMVVLNLKRLLNDGLMEEAEAFLAKIQEACPGTDLAKISSKYVEEKKKDIQQGKEQTAKLTEAAHAAPLRDEYKAFEPLSTAFFRKEPREDLREGEIALYQIGGRVFVVFKDRPLGQDRHHVESLEELKTYLDDPRLRKPS